MHLDTNDLCVGIFQAVTEIGGISGGGITRFDCSLKYERGSLARVPPLSEMIKHRYN